MYENIVFCYSLNLMNNQMDFISKVSWLIPSFPFLAAFLVGLLLILFRRTMNRLTKPVTLIMILSVLLSTIISILLFMIHFDGELINVSLSSLKPGLNFILYTNEMSSEILAFLGITFVSIISFSYVKLPRNKGYVAYLCFLGFLASAVFIIVMGGTPLTTILNGI
tara:strand:- start:4 stop:501 length:498 start_codon:yes stop_codon:yes gene_type:complete